MKLDSFFCLLFVVVFGSCERTKSYSSIEDHKFKADLGGVLQKASLRLGEAECAIFRMDTLTKFAWDKMYVIGGNVFKDQIAEQIGIPWEYEGGVGILSEGNLLLVFVKDRKIVSTVKYIEGDPKFKSFSTGTLGEYTSNGNSFYYIYKQFYESYEGFYLKMRPIDKDSLIKHNKSIDGLKIVSIYNSIN